MSTMNQLPEIQVHDGILDTFVLSLDASRIEDEDRNHLADLGFSGEFGHVVRSDGSSSEKRDRDRWWRTSDGARVYRGKSRIKVEFSIPRVLGMENYRQAEVTESQALGAIRSMTSELLPATTARARRFSKRRWVVERLDLARNFQGDVALVSPEYLDTKHPRILDLPRQNANGNLEWIGDGSKLTLYDKGLVQGNAPGKLGRVERRFRTPRTMRHLVQHLDRGSDLHLLSVVGGKEVPVGVKLDYVRLHQFVAMELLQMAPTRTEGLPEPTTLEEWGLYHLATDERALRRAKRRTAPRTYSRWRKKIQTMRRRRKSAFLPWLCYGIKPKRSRRLGREEWERG